MGEDKLERTPDDINNLCEKYIWLCELGRGKENISLQKHFRIYRVRGVAV